MSAKHRQVKFADPVEHEDVMKAWERMHRQKKRGQQRQASRLNDELVRTLLGRCGSKLRDFRDTARLVAGYVTLCQRSELTALQLADLRVAPDGLGSITISSSKADQQRLEATSAIPVDAMRQVLRWIDMARIKHGPLFRAVRRSGRFGAAHRPDDVSCASKEMALRAGHSAEARPDLRSRDEK